MKKKIIVLVGSLLMISSLTACGVGEIVANKAKDLVVEKMNESIENSSDISEEDRELAKKVVMAVTSQEGDEETAKQTIADLLDTMIRKAMEEKGDGSYLYREVHDDQIDAWRSFCEKYDQADNQTFEFGDEFDMNSFCGYYYDESKGKTDNDYVIKLYNYKYVYTIKSLSLEQVEAFINSSEGITED